MSDFRIPIDNEIVEFRKHLLAHPRTILSAAYGDGKSYFVQKFIKSSAAKNKFVFLKLFPVNYQVVENRDIFDLIKYDVLFQLFKNEMIEQGVVFEKKTLLNWFLYLKGEKFLPVALKWAELLSSPSDSLNRLISGMESIPILQRLYKEWDTFASQYSETDVKIREFIDQQDCHFLYEADPVTNFIQEVICNYKKRYPRKKVVLLIEDLDRLDPAHLFRILNVLSAHMDYSYKMGQSPKRSSLVGNKFGVDNIVLVMDYTNMEKIFHHFYGTETKIEGYINKFCSNEIFRYSFSVVREKYIIEHLLTETGLSSQLLNLLLHNDLFRNKNLRSIVHAIHNTKDQIFCENRYHDVNTDVGLHEGILKMMVVMRRMGMNEQAIVEDVTLAIRKDPFNMMINLGGYYLNMKNRFSASFDVIMPRQSMVTHVNINGVNERGYAYVDTSQSVLLNDDRMDDMPLFVQWLLKKIGR